MLPSLGNKVSAVLIVKPDADITGYEHDGQGCPAKINVTILREVSSTESENINKELYNMTKWEYIQGWFNVGK